MTGFRFKIILAFILNIFGINNISLRLLNAKYKNNYIRILNYHETFDKDINRLEKQFSWFSKNFENCDYNKFKRFMNREYIFKSKPGIMITFDDGYIGNFKNALPLLNKHDFTGYFFVSTGLVGSSGYIDTEQLESLVRSGHIVGCHTYTHHRMSINDSVETVDKEIKYAKIDLERILNSPIEIFCWVGGEEETYTFKAANCIRKSGYKFSMMTNSAPVTQNDDSFQIDRTNIESFWTFSMAKFQVSGLLDIKFRSKRKRIHELTKIVEMN